MHIRTLSGDDLSVSTTSESMSLVFAGSEVDTLRTYLYNTDYEWVRSIPMTVIGIANKRGGNICRAEEESV